MASRGEIKGNSAECKGYHLTPKLALGLAAPHTWGAASVFPAFLGAGLAFSHTGEFSLPLFLILLAIVLLMHSSVNTLNDYFDFIKGTDTLENSDDPEDAILVYNRLDTRQVLMLGVGYLALAALLGCYVVCRAGLIPLIIGLVGGLTITGYSAGKLPISYLPVGEAVSGFVMGGLIPLAICTVLTGKADFGVLWRALPMIIGIGLIMMTNNISDIERDTISGRKTLPVLMGRPAARTVYACTVTLWLFSLVCIGFFAYPAGVPVLPVMLILCGGIFLKIFHTPLTPELRRSSMGLIIRGNLAADTAYLAMIVMDTILR